MIENEKALSELEIDILNVILQYPNNEININTLDGYYKFMAGDLDKSLRHLTVLGLVREVTDFPATVYNPVYYITQAGREYAHAQNVLSGRAQEARRSLKIDWIKWWAPLALGAIGGGVSSLITLFGSEIRNFFGL